MGGGPGAVLSTMNCLCMYLMWHMYVCMSTCMHMCELSILTGACVCKCVSIYVASKYNSVFNTQQVDWQNSSSPLSNKNIFVIYELTCSY